MALPIALRLLAHGFALRLRRLTVGNAVRLLTYGNALGTVEHLASLVRTLDLTLGFLALNVANGVPGLCAGGMALGGFAYWIADGWAVGVVALP